LNVFQRFKDAHAFGFDMKKNFFESKIIHILLHLLAWSIFIVLPLYFNNRWQVGKDFIWLYYINIIINGIIFYINYFVLVPKFFFGTRKFRYFLSVLAVIAVFYFVSDISNKVVFEYVPGRAEVEDMIRRSEQERRPAPPPGGRIPGRPPFREMHLFNYSFNSLFLIFFSLGLRILERHSRIEKWQKELEKEKLNSELAFLKNQISPHFFFNTLNNIYSLINVNKEDSQEAVLKLSKLMRYLLYESEQGQTLLSSEIGFMNNYIDLMKLRMSEKIDLSVTFPDKYEDIDFPPLIFIPFIENAFKHGISYREKSFIDINMKVTKEKIIFRCANSVAGANNKTENNHSGIGLENVKKRLNLLFPDKHKLEIDKADNVFKIDLTIITGKA